GEVSSGTDRLLAIRAEIDGPLADIQELQARSELQVSEVAAAATDGLRRLMADRIPETDAAMDDAVERFEAGLAGWGEPPGPWVSFTRTRDAWVSLRDQSMVPVALSGNRSRYAVLQTESSRPMIEKMTADLAAVDEYVTEHADQVADEVADRTAAAPRTLIGTGLVGLLLVLPLGW